MPKSKEMEEYAAKSLSRIRRKAQTDAFMWLKIETGGWDDIKCSKGILCQTQTKVSRLSSRGSKNICFAKKLNEKNIHRYNENDKL